MIPMGEVNKDKNSDEWENIKNWVGGANRARKHPLEQIADRQNVKGYDEGGDVDPMADIYRQIQPQGAGLIAPSAAPPVKPMQAPPMAPPPQPVAPQMAPKPQVAPPMPISQPPPPTNESYNQQASGILGNTPQGLQSYLQKIMKPGIGERVGNGLSGLSDAIMQGVARAGPSHFQENYQKNAQQQKENMAGIPGQVAGVGKEQFGLAHQLQTQDPNSPYSKIEQNANKEFLKQLGMKDSDVSKLPADAINDIRTGKVEWSKALAEIESTGTYRAGMLGLQKMGEQTRQEESETREKDQERAALEKIAGGSPIPFVGPSHAEKQAAIQRLEQLGGIGGAQGVKSFNSVDEAEASGLPKGTRISIGGRMGTIQ